MATELLGHAPRTLLEALDSRANSYAERTAYIFLGDGEAELGRMSFGELRRRSIVVAERLTALNARGERAILLYPQGLDFIVAFFGCLYAGVVAVPASIPSRKRGLEALERVASDSGARWVLSTHGPLEEFATALATKRDGLAYFDSGGEIEAEIVPRLLPTIEASQLALLQYTSGSTGSPRGVAVSHGNLAANQEQVRQSFAFDGSTRMGSWLPMFHDMGLGTVLVSVWCGVPCVLMSPRGFLQEPRRWLQAVSTYRVTVTGAPDFAYDLCARRVSECERVGLDLSSWLVAYNGSEPVRAATVERFSAAFAASGFRREAFHPVYGLAEATLFVSSEDATRAPLIKRFREAALERGLGEAASPADAATRELVSCGHPLPGTRLLIVDPETRAACAPREVGEILIQGTNVALGYWGQAAETAETFGFTIATGEGPFLRTGDLGFLDEDHLYVTGRLKDLIIVRGRNHYPHDVEDSVSTSHPALVPLACAAFSIETDLGEELVIVQEVARNALRTLDVAGVVRAIRRAASEHHSLHTHAVVLLKPSTLPRTTSGKVRRKACRRAFLDNTLPAVAAWVAPPAPISDADVDPDSRRRTSAARADKLIDWLRGNAADLIHSHAADARRSPAVGDRQVVPNSLLRDFAKQGLLGMQVELEHGGLGLSHRDSARVLEQLAAFDFALALFVGLNNCLGIQPIAKYAKPVAQALLLPGLAQGRELAAFAFEEPGGTPPSGMAVLAQPDGEDSWHLFGTKYLGGAAHGANVFTVFARHEEPPVISAFVVSDEVEGLRKVLDGLSFGVLGFARDTVALDGARVGRENLLGNLGSGLEIAHEATTHARLAIAIACVGGMKRCAQLVRPDAPSSGGFSGKLTPNPVALSRLGSVTTRIAALECLVQAIARALDTGHAVPAEAFAACKILGPQLLLKCIDDLTQFGVSGGYADANHLSALYRDAGLLRNFDGSPETVAELIGANVMAGDASLRVLIEEILQAPDTLPWMGPLIEAVRQRMTVLEGALAPRAQRWGHTRAGELTTWLILFAAVEGTHNAAPSSELARTHTWARAQLEHALSTVRAGTPAETATLDFSDIARTFAAYARTIGAPGRAPKIPSNGHDVAPAEAGALANSLDPTRLTGSDELPRAAEALRRELRSWVTSWLARRLQIAVAQIETDRSFADHGLDSVAAVEFSKALSDRLGRELDEALLWNCSTIDQLVEHLVIPSARASAPPEARFETDAVLDLDIRPDSASPPAAEPTSVFLTGATGFLGAFLLCELLQQTQAQVSCLVRAGDAASGASRVIENLRRYGLWNDAFGSRLSFLAGDLGRPRLGLHEATFARLGEEIDAIYNNGAQLSFVAAYRDLKGSHVSGTRELLRLASLGRSKAVHHISSTSVYDSIAYRGRSLVESVRPTESQGLHLGYAQCKWVSENLVWEAADRGVVVTVHRPGFIAGSSLNGAWNTSDFMCRLLKSIVESGYIPGDLDIELDFSPVDYVSRSIVQLSRQLTARGRAFHLQHPHGIAFASLRPLLESFGYAISAIPYWDWVKLIRSRPGSPLYPLLPFLTQRWTDERLSSLQLWQRAYRPELKCAETRAALAIAGIDCPPLDSQLFDRYLRYLIAAGFITPPKDAGSSARDH